MCVVCVWSWLSRQSRDSGYSCICRCCCCCTSRAEAESYRSSLGILGETKVRDILLLASTTDQTDRGVHEPPLNARPRLSSSTRTRRSTSPSPHPILPAGHPVSHPSTHWPRIAAGTKPNLQPGLVGGSGQGATVIPAEETSFHTLPYLKYLFLPRDRPLVVPLLWGCRHISSTDCEDAASSPVPTVHIHTHIPFRSLTFFRSYRLAITPRRFLVLGLLLLHPWVLGAHSADHLGAWVLKRNQSDTSRSDPLFFLLHHLDSTCTASCDGIDLLS